MLGNGSGYKAINELDTRGHKAMARVCLCFRAESHSTERATLNPSTKLMPLNVLASLLCTPPHLNPVE